MPAMAEVTLDVPETFLPHIGRIIILWAFIEHRLTKLIADLAGIEQKPSRLVMKRFNAQGYLPEIRNLLKIRRLRIGMTEKQIKALSAHIDRVAMERDHLAHGLWAIVPGLKDPTLRVTRGNAVIEGRGRRIDPEVMLLTAPSLRSQVRDMERLIPKIERLRHACLKKPRKLKKPRRKSSGQYQIEAHRDHASAKRILQRLASRAKSDRGSRGV